MTTLVDRLFDRLRRRPDDTALVLILHGAEQAFTIREFASRAMHYASRLRNNGIGPGDLVILVVEHSEALIFSFWGALLLGAIPSIFPFLSDRLDPDHYYGSVRQLVERSDARAIVVGNAQRPALERALDGLALRLITAEAMTAESKREALVFESAGTEPDDTAFLQHSSGSTGLQKGVMLSHRAVLNQIEAYSSAIGLTGSDVIVSWLPLYHDMGLIAGFVMPVVAGIPLVLMSPFHWVRDPQILLHAIHRRRGTLCWLPNFAYNFMATRVRDSQIEGIDLSSWRAAINCSEPVAASSHRQFLQRFAPYGFRDEALSVCYAMAENTFAVTQTALPGPPRIDCVDLRALREEHRALPSPSGSGQVTEIISCGRPIEGCEIRIVNEQRMPLPERVVGEIALRSNSMLSGYFRQPELSAQAVQDGWYFTGDMGYLAEGELFVTGRRKDLIIVGGKNIYPQDIEAILNEIKGVHPGRCAAFGVNNERLGTEDIAVVAEVDTDDSNARTEIERAIRATVAQRLDVTVRYVKLVGPKWLIKTSSGKVSRAANRDKFLTEAGWQAQ